MANDYLVNNFFQESDETLNLLRVWNVGFITRSTLIIYFMVKSFSHFILKLNVLLYYIVADNINYITICFNTFKDYFSYIHFTYLNILNNIYKL